MNYRILMIQLSMLGLVLSMNPAVANASSIPKLLDCSGFVGDNAFSKQLSEDDKSSDVLSKSGKITLNIERSLGFPTWGGHPAITEDGQQISVQITVKSTKGEVLASSSSLGATQNFSVKANGEWVTMSCTEHW